MQHLKKDWLTKVSNIHQVGGIETCVLDNGDGRGARIAWVNTGTGLRYKVVLDRAMDIADAFYNQYSLAWLSNVGIKAPGSSKDTGTEWLKAFGGGLLTTCGLSHVGPPEEDEYGCRGLHGEISGCAAEIESIIQPDLLRGKLEMSIRGRIRQSRVFGPNLTLIRTISGVIGRPQIWIKDEVVNEGNTEAEHMLLYHFNFGWPLVDEGTDILWRGEWKPRAENDELIFNKLQNFHKCSSPLDAHNGAGEATAFIDVAADKNGFSNCGLYNPVLKLGVSIEFQKKQLPWLTNWQHWGYGEYVTGLEPGTNPPIGQMKARKEGKLIKLAPGESRNYELEIKVLKGE